MYWFAIERMDGNKKGAPKHVTDCSYTKWSNRIEMKNEDGDWCKNNGKEMIIKKAIGPGHRSNGICLRRAAAAAHNTRPMQNKTIQEQNKVKSEKRKKKQKSKETNRKGTKVKWKRLISFKNAEWIRLWNKTKKREKEMKWYETKTKSERNGKKRQQFREDEWFGFFNE